MKKERIKGIILFFLLFSQIKLIFADDINNTTQQRPLHSFSIELPRDITAAIQTIRAGIERRGGSFHGDEYEGNFKYSGVMGNYVVGEKVVFNIYEKPFLLPNILIERAIRNYFIGK